MNLSGHYANMKCRRADLAQGWAQSTSRAGTVSVCVEVWEKTLCCMCMYLCVWVLLLFVLDVCAEVWEETLCLYARMHARMRAGTRQHAGNTENDTYCN